MNKPQSNLKYTKGYGKNYANLRKEEYNGKKDYTVRELEKEINISSSTISQIEKEKRTPTVEQVMIYKEFFGVSLDYLVGDTKVLKSDVKTICEYTGLDSQTIEQLHSMLNGRYRESQYVKVIDLIVKNYCPPDENGYGKVGVLEHLWEYFFAEYEALPINFEKFCEDDRNPHELLETESEKLIFLRYKDIGQVAMRPVSVIKDILLPQIQSELMQLRYELESHNK